MSKWFINYRLKWIKLFIDSENYISRQVIINKFDIASAQATRDITTIRKAFPKLLTYEPTIKKYITKKYRIVQGDESESAKIKSIKLVL